MPLQNRVDPFGTIFRTSARGTMMGNRGGAIHNDEREIVQSFKSRRWITCVLEFKGRKRSVMTPGRYTELFFLDEAVALAAGHRPCAECRRERYKAFQNAWARWSGEFSGADEMDRQLHVARIDRQRRKVTWESGLKALPTGCFVEIEGSAYLVQEDALVLWTPEGYGARMGKPSDLVVKVLTPQPTVKCIAEGYRPGIQRSADREHTR